MPASDMLDEELNAIRGGMGGDILVTCDTGVLPDGTECKKGITSLKPGGDGNFNGGGVNTDGQGNNPGGKKP